VKLVIPPAFRRRLHRKPVELQAAILEAVDRLAADPRHTGLHTHRVQGTEKVWEARIDRSNRLTFHYESGAIVLRKHCNHDILRNP
jgi:hypothetical protein